MWGPCWRMAMTTRPSFIARLLLAWFIPESTARMDCRGVSPAKVWMTGE